MKKYLILFVALFSLSLVLEAQGNAVITAVDLKYGTRKHTDILSLSMGKLMDFSTRKPMYSIEGNRVFKGKSKDAGDQLFEISLDSLYVGEGTVTHTPSGEVWFKIKNAALHDAKGNFLLQADAYNEKKLKLFFRDAAQKGKVKGSYIGKELSPAETVLVMIGIHEALNDLNYRE